MINTRGLEDWHRFDDHEWTGYTTDALSRKLRHLHRVATAVGVRVIMGRFAPERARRFGEYRDPERVIVLNEKLHAHQAVDTIGHEISHAIHRDRFSTPANEDRADRLSVAMALDPERFDEEFEPDRHLWASPNFDQRAVVDTFACGSRILRRHAEHLFLERSNRKVVITPTTFPGLDFADIKKVGKS